MKKRTLIYGLCLSTAILLSACGNSANAKVEPSAESVVSPMDYKYSEKTKTELYFASDSKTVYDISDNVSNYSSGDLFLDSDGLDKVFGLKQLTPTEEDKNLFKSYETENSFDGSTGDIVKFANDKLTLLTRVGSTLYLANGEVKTFSYPPIENEGKLSLPMFDIAFSSGYDSIGNSVAGDQLTYIIYDTIDGNMAPTPNAETESESADASAETTTESETETDATESVEDSSVEETNAETATESVEETAAESVEGTDSVTETVAETEATAAAQ